ncbi:unnamed protein product, partial [Medioppia subpectinata]
MSSAPAQAPPKSQSSILLSTANLSWTPTSGAALLAAPQPPEVVAPPPTVSSPVPSDHSSITGLQHSMTNEEIIRSLRLPTSAVADTESIDSQALEESFQTISLADGRAGTPVATGAAGGGDDLLSGEQSPIGSTVSSLSSASALNQKHQKLSFIESLATAFHKTSQVLASGGGGGGGGSGQTGAAAAAGADGQQSIPDNYQPPLSQFVPSQSLPPPPPPLSVAAVQPPPPPPPVLSAAESVVAKDFKLRGPLRLYDPNHGISGHSGAAVGQPLPPQLPLPPLPSYIPQATDDQSLPAPQPVPTLPFPQPSAADTLYNPNDYYDNTAATPGGQSPAPPPLDIAQSYTGQSYDLTFGATPLPLDNSAANSSGSTTTGDYSFISQPSATINPWETAPDPTQQQPYTATLDQLAGTGSAQQPYQPYTPVLHHWFYQQIVENREVWRPFSLYDSYNLEQAVQYGQDYGHGGYDGATTTPAAVIATDGGRFDVSVPERIRRPVYWSEPDTLCRRCSWFYRREGHNRWIPYTEEVAERLEQRYRESAAGNRWNTRVELDGGQEAVVMHSPLSIYHYQLDQTMPDGWGQAVENPQRPRVVCRAGP